MAKPQAEEGFVMIALDLFVALMTCDIPNREAVVLAEVLSQSYGPAKRRNVHLDLVAMEDITGVHRNNIRRAIAGLVDGRIIARNDDGTYRFLKDWESYRPGGKPFVERLDGKLAVFARNVKSRFGRMKGSAKDPIQLDSPAIQLDSPSGQNRNPTGLTFSPKPQSNGIGPTADVSAGTVDVNPETPLTNENALACERVHAPEDNSDCLDQAEQSAARPRVEILKSTPDGPGDPAMMQPYPGGIDVTEIGAGPHALADADARSIYARLWTAFGSMQVCRGFVSGQRLHAAETWRAAIRELVESGKRPGTIRLVDLRAGDIEVRAPGRPNGRAAPAEKPAPRYPPADPEAAERYRNIKPPGPKP